MKKYFFFQKWTNKIKYNIRFQLFSINNIIYLYYEIKKFLNHYSNLIYISFLRYLLSILDRKENLFVWNYERKRESVCMKLWKEKRICLYEIEKEKRISLMKLNLFVWNWEWERESIHMKLRIRKRISLMELNLFVWN